jgi:glycosyltransferase involved in cell wall biosynthesis
LGKLSDVPALIFAMRFLFLHNNFPAQFRHIIQELAKDEKNEVFFVTKAEEPQMAGVTKLLYQPSRTPHPTTHHYLQPVENSILHGQAVFSLMEKLKKQGFVPDVMCGHSGWGPTLFLKDAFPDTPLLCYFEWFYNIKGGDMDFDPRSPYSIDDMARVRIKNASILVELYSCDQGLSPTYWQRSQIPKEFHSKIEVLHDGVDTDFFVPKPGAKLSLPGLDLTGVDEIVTYVGRGMEPYRGFPQFIESIAYLQEQRPNCHVVVVGSERVCYGKSLPNGESYKDLMLKKVPLDLTRLHFVGSLPYSQYLQVIQASSVHVYLTYPFVLSWSMIESLATGCLVLGSDTPPVREVIRDGENGLLVDFFNPEAIAKRIGEVLDHPDRMAEIRKQARQTALDRYSLKDLLQQQIALIKGLV